MGCYKCPVCNGKGFVPNNFYNIEPNVENYSTNSTSTEICRSCRGTGIVWEPVNNVPFATGLSTTAELGMDNMKIATVTTNEHRCECCDFHKNIRNCGNTIYCIEHKNYRQSNDCCSSWRRTTTTATDNYSGQIE